MGKHKNRKKGPVQQPQSSYHHFLNEMQFVVSLVDPERNLAKMDHEFKEMMYKYLIHINNPKAGNEHITPKELKLIADKTKRYYRLPNFELEGKKISNYHVHLLWCYITIRVKEIEKETDDIKNLELVTYKGLASQLVTSFYGKYLLDNFKIITQLSTPDHKYYGIHIRPAAIFKDNPTMELVTEIYGVPAQKCVMEISGIKRPAFRLGKALATNPVEWITVDVSLLKDFYKGGKDMLDVYIQSHALSRLRERLDQLDNEAINYALWENTQNITQFESYRGFLLLPFKVFDLKIGYLVARIVDEKLLFRTFLFITHNCTPEGDRLKKLTGLGDEDVSYWHIDRLSTFVSLKEEKYPDLIQLFGKAGIGDLMHLKNKEFSIDNMQTANLDGLSEYIRMGRLEIQKDEWEKK